MKITSSTTAARCRLLTRRATAAVTFKLAEPYMIAAKLLELLDQSGTALGAINNLGAYR